MLYLTCSMISSVDLSVEEYLVLKIGYLWIVIQLMLKALKNLVECSWREYTISYCYL